MDLNDLRSRVLDECVRLNGELGTVILTGEKDLDISQDVLEEKILMNKEGKGYLEAFKSEYKLLERQGLISKYLNSQGRHFQIPDWDRFISAIRAFYDMCYTPEIREDRNVD